ncbi:hypothetical protein [Carboxylicivirga taeanensis]|uniref:hypothetical protein n=1 Tax=Carboxylicivirga taeanensis TaxID=1416875 RepID=UPI003F6DC526
MAEDTSEPLVLSFYSLKVQGVISLSDLNYFEDMDIRFLTSKRGERISILSGHVKDQSALIGMINMLYDFHYPIISIESSMEP